jgi:hypothetical protein
MATCAKSRKPWEIKGIMRQSVSISAEQSGNLDGEKMAAAARAL